MLCWPRLVFTTTLETMLLLELPVANISASALSRSSTLAIPTSSDQFPLTNSPLARSEKQQPWKWIRLTDLVFVWSCHDNYDVKMLVGFCWCLAYDDGYLWYCLLVFVIAHGVGGLDTFVNMFIDTICGARYNGLLKTYNYGTITYSAYNKLNVW